MTTAQYIFYFLWFLAPTIYILVGIGSKLEQMSKSHKKQKPAEFFKQAWFLLIIAVICVLIDQFILPVFKDKLPEFIPYGFLQLVLFPLVAWGVAMITGGSKEIKIEKISRVGKGRRK